MSDIRTIDLAIVEELVEFARGRGYVLDFSDRTYSDFFSSELDVDIGDPVYAELGTSKGKRLRCFLQKVDNKTAIRALQSLWEYRCELLARMKEDDPSPNAEGRFLSLIHRLGGGTRAGTQQSPKRAFNLDGLKQLRSQLHSIASLPPQERGYAFERFLKAAFDLFGLAAREPFRNRGEQIDGSFVLGADIYLVEAKWQAQKTGVLDLRAFNGKVEDKAAWARGLFLSYAGFTDEGLDAFGRAKRIICMDGLDLDDALSRQIPFTDVLERKVRRAAETGKPFVRVRDLFSI